MNPPLPQDAKLHQLEWIISTILRTGVIVSLTLIVLGTVVTFVHHPDYLQSAEALKRLTAPDAPRPQTLHMVFERVVQARGQAIIMLGLLFLIATPIVRVGISIAAFVLRKDRAFVIITTVVFILLLLSFILGRAGG